MTFFSAFALSFGLMLALMATIAAWLFRTSGAPLIAKLAIPTLLVALACYAPGAVNAMLGLPMTASFAALPDRAELVAFVAHDEEGIVDLWLRPSTGSGQAIPRAYETPLDDRLKKTLREAQEQMAHGRPAMLVKRPSTGSGQARHAGDAPGFNPGVGIGDDQSGYELDESALSRLPAKRPAE